MVAQCKSIFLHKNDGNIKNIVPISSPFIPKQLAAYTYLYTHFTKFFYVVTILTKDIVSSSIKMNYCYIKVFKNFIGSNLLVDTLAFCPSYQSLVIIFKLINARSQQFIFLERKTRGRTMSILMLQAV